MGGSTFYKANDNRAVVALLIKKGRAEDRLINVLCKDKEVVVAISEWLWNKSIPHYIPGDPYIERNNVFVTSEEKPADMIIVYETPSFADVYKCTKKCFVGGVYDFDGKYWVLDKNKWIEITKEAYLSYEPSF